MLLNTSLSPTIYLISTHRFQVYDIDRESLHRSTTLVTNPPVRLHTNIGDDGGAVRGDDDVSIWLNWNCAYTRQVIQEALRLRPWCHLLPSLDLDNAQYHSNNRFLLEIADFENINWEDVLSSHGQHGASSYLIRKGLSRKAQLALQLRRYLSKHPHSVLTKAIPDTAIIETWNAFEDDMKIDFGGLSASFDLPSMQRAPLRERLHWVLSELYDSHFTNKADDLLYILKPSVTNKGSDISLIYDWDDLLDALERSPDLREWVLQKYIGNPLLIDGHKFHLRVYVLCVGALRVFVFQEILVLLAARKYEEFNLEDIYGHLTNTARAAEQAHFDEARYVKLLRDWPSLLRQDYPRRFPTEEKAQAFVDSVRKQVNAITGALFEAYENEYSVFCPMGHCFELYGLDFLVDERGVVSLLEVNPGPDFVQTGERLRSVIVNLWEETLRIVADSDVLRESNEFSAWSEIWEHSLKKQAPHFEMVYNKEWSVNRMQGGTGMTLK